MHTTDAEAVHEPGDTWLDLDVASATISGCLHEGARSPEPFCGWLELVALIEDARARHHTQPYAAPDQRPAQPLRAIDSR
jgi:hypothetical protein